jgi:hypothetical protein
MTRTETKHAYVDQLLVRHLPTGLTGLIVALDVDDDGNHYLQIDDHEKIDMDGEPYKRQLDSVGLLASVDELELAK